LIAFAAANYATYENYTSWKEQNIKNL